LYNPARIALAGIGVWIFFWLITPVYATSTLEPTAMLYIAFCYAGFFLGCGAYTLTSGVEDAAVPTSDWRMPQLSRLFWISLAVGLAGMALRLYDRIVLRGADYATNALDFRESLTQTAAGPVSAVAALLFPFCFVPLITLLAARFRPRQIPLYMIAAVAFVLPTIESLAQLSRSVLLTSVVLGFGAVTCTKFRGSPANRKLLVVSVAAIILFSIVSTTIFTNRLELGERRLSDSVITSVYADNLQPTEAAWWGLMSGSELESRYYSIILPNGMYYISGAYEFSSLWTRPDPQPFSYGAYNAIAFVRLLQIVFSPDSEPIDEVALVYKPGVFQTFFGNAWVDFGYFGPLFLFAFGYLANVLGRGARSGRLNLLPIYLYITVIIFFMPVANFINGGLGNYVVASFILVAMFGPRGTPEPERPGVRAHRRHHEAPQRPQPGA
jgi:oligosaccharide repeat unit polymerase